MATVFNTVTSNTIESMMEKCALFELHDLLMCQRFPFKNIRFNVIFDYRMTDFASHKLDVKALRSGVKGKVTLVINALFLHKSPDIYLGGCLPHELAHIFSSLESIKDGEGPDPNHGLDWQRWLAKINSEASVQTNYTAEFDRRGIMLHKGGLPCRCECPGSSGFTVKANTRKNINRLKEQFYYCDSCNVPIRRNDESIPDHVKCDMEFIQKMTFKQSSTSNSESDMEEQYA